MKKNLFLILFALFSVIPALAKEAAPAMDPAIEARFRALTTELRCVKCQNQDIYDSQAGVAEDLRRQIREQMHQGKTDQEIVDYLVARYGDFVRYRPPLKPLTALLWFGPFLFLVIGVTMLLLQIRKRRQRLDNAPLGEEERRRAQMLLEGQTGDK